MIVYIIYTLASTYPQVVTSLLCLYITFVLVIGVRWKKLTTFFRALSLFFISAPIIFVGLIYIAVWFEHSSDKIRRSDYKGGCKVEELINGDCIFDSIRWEHANFYPTVTEDDGIWERLEDSDKVELLKTAKKELKRINANEEYKGRQEQIVRVQSFIDILRYQYGVGVGEEDLPQEEVVVDTTDWKSYRNEKYGISIKYPIGWDVQVENGNIGIYQNDNWVKLYPTGRSGFSCYLAGMVGDFEQLKTADSGQEFFTWQGNGGKLRTCSTDLDKYPRNWNENALIDMNYDASLKATVKSIVESMVFLRKTIDATSLKLYGSRIGMQGTVSVDTRNWKTESNKEISFSFKYPNGSKITNEGNCYRVEYGQGFVIFLLPIEGDMRCGARTGVGVLPDNTIVTDRLKIQGKEYAVSGFRAIMDTKGEMFYKPETRYFYDFHHMLSTDSDLDSCQKDCIKIGYGIYKEVPTPLSKTEVDRTMDSLRAIVESLQYEK